MLILADLAKALEEGDSSQVKDLTARALQEGTAPTRILKEGLFAGMDVVGAKFKNGDFYIPHVLIAARAMQAGMETLKPHLIAAGTKPAGKFIIGTVQGDYHDIGKNLVAMMLKGAGFEVLDLGVDASPEKFVTKAKECKPQVIGLSALLTTTMPAMEKILRALKDAGIPAKTMIGGAPVTQTYADKIGANGYAPDAASAVDLAKSLLN